GAQVIDGGWSADYPSADDFIVKLTCSHFAPGNGQATTDASEFCNPALDRQAARAAQLQTTAPPPRPGGPGSTSSSPTSRSGCPPSPPTRPTSSPAAPATTTTTPCRERSSTSSPSGDAGQEFERLRPQPGRQEAEAGAEFLLHLRERAFEEALEQRALPGVSQPAHIRAGPVRVDAAHQPRRRRDAITQRGRRAVGE